MVKEPDRPIALQPTTMSKYELRRLDDEASAALLNSAFATGNTALIIRSVGLIARARGLAALSKATGLGKTTLYHALREGANPTLHTFMRVLDGLQLEMRVSAKFVGRQWVIGDGDYPASVIGSLTAGDSPIAAWRTYRRLSQAALARESGMSQTSISQIARMQRNGNRKIDQSSLEAIARVLQVPVAALAYEKTDIIQVDETMSNSADQYRAVVDDP